MQEKMVFRQNQKKYILIFIAILLAVVFWWTGFPLLNISQNESVVPWESIPQSELHDKWIIVTSIQDPTEPVKVLAKIPGWKMLVVGDLKTPKGWSYPGVTYLDVETQKKLPYSIIKHIPYKSYSRKNIGYLYAIQHGAQLIYETDDDNLAETAFKGFNLDAVSWNFIVKTQNLTYNPYVHFGQSTLWPRGYPLEYLPLNTPHSYRLCKTVRPAVQQGVVNGDPDLDATYRLTRKNEQRRIDVSFDLLAPSVTLPKGTYCPYNCQDTMISYPVFWSLLLPISRNMRTLDIYRGYIAEKVMWMIGERVAFVATDTYQKRNVHSYLKDALDEFEFLKMGKFVELIHKWQCPSDQVDVCLIKIHELAYEHGFYEKRDVDSVKAWLSDLKKIGYKFPISQPKDICIEGHDSENIHYYSEEQTTTMFHTPDKFVMQATTGKLPISTELSKLCKGKLSNVRFTDPLVKDRNTLLIIDVKNSPDRIPQMDAWYRPKYPLILYCASGHSQIQQYADKLKVSIIAPPVGKAAGMAGCLYLASKMDYKVKSYLYINSNMLFPHKPITFGKSVRMTTDYFKPEVNCTSDCITVNKADLRKFSEIFVNLPEFSKVDNEKIQKCLKTKADSVAQAEKIQFKKSTAFYLPRQKNIIVPIIRFTEKYLATVSADVADLFTAGLAACIDPNLSYLKPQKYSQSFSGDYIFPLDASVLSYYCANVY